MLVRSYIDNVAEWLRRWIANPLFSERVSSNLTIVAIFLNCSTNSEFCHCRILFYCYHDTMKPLSSLWRHFIKSLLLFSFFLFQSFSYAIEYFFSTLMAFRHNPHNIYIIILKILLILTKT
jgi:hypothetical protein